MRNYTVYTITDLTGGTRIKRRMAHSGDLYDVAREVVGKSLYLSAPDMDGGRAIIRYAFTDEIAFIITPEEIERREQELKQDAQKITEAQKEELTAVFMHAMKKRAEALEALKRRETPETLRNFHEASATVRGVINTLAALRLTAEIAERAQEVKQ